MKGKWRSLWILVLFFHGCVAQTHQQEPVALLHGVSEEGTPICLANPSGIPSIVQKFFATRDLTTEEGKIDYLLERLRSSRLTFYRNKVEYTGQSAAEFLRWKMNRWKSRYHTKIDMAQDFVVKIASSSKMSGQPYVVVLSDGSRHPLQSVLQNELDALEACLKEYSEPETKEEAKPEAGADVADAVLPNQKV
ncbi:MAG: DUF5329 family protein [Candidatus Omnitrophica bacterium]|nr:DUF5329 family protein [Candidatus Omnitrophota bacterium]